MDLFAKSLYQPSTGNPESIAARVISIILDDTHPLFKAYGEWDSIGTVFFDFIENPSAYRPEDDPQSEALASYPTAKPLFPQIKNFPLINEIVYAFSAPSLELVTATSAKNYYYISPLNIWNSQQHNVIPEQTFNNFKSDNQQKTIQQIEAGSPQIENSTNLDVKIGNTFIPQSKIYPLRPYEGDVIYEGRWGNSIRFGSTVRDKGNNWSNTGVNGSPIIIIRNGQYLTTQLPGQYILEDINQDDSSIYFTSTQQIPLTPSSQDYTSYISDSPTNIAEYTGKQIIITSGRLVFNTTEDHLMFSSKKTINLNSIEGFNVDTRGNAVIQATKVYLGDSEDSLTQPVVLGDDLVSLLTDILTDLNTLTRTLQNQIGVPVGTPLAPTSLTAQLVADKIPSYKRRVSQLLSNTTRTAV